MRVLEGNDALAAQIRLQIRHQQSAGNSFSGDVAQHQRDPILTQMKEVVVVATDLASLNADARIVECFQGWKGLGEESGLHLLGDLQFLSGAAFGFKLLRCGAPLCLHRLGHFVEAHQREGIFVDILEAGKNSAPNRRLFAQQATRENAEPSFGTSPAADT